MYALGGWRNSTDVSSLGLLVWCTAVIVQLAGLTAQMTGYVITFRTAYVATFPFAGKTKIVGALASDVIIAQVTVELLWVFVHLLALFPTTLGRLRNLVMDWVVGRKALLSARTW